MPYPVAEPNLNWRFAPPLCSAAAGLVFDLDGGWSWAAAQRALPGGQWWDNLGAIKRRERVRRQSTFTSPHRRTAGTLLDTMPHHWAAWEAVSQDYAFSLTLPELLALAGKPSPEILDILCERQVRL